MFCPICGSTDKTMIGDICIDCFLKDYQFLEIPENINVIICSHCNAKYFQGKWIESNIPQEEIIYRALEENIHLDDMIENEIIDLEINQMRGTIAECTVKGEGNIKGKKINEKYEINVKIKNSVCPTCSKRSSGYYETVIQLRADKRDITNEEQKFADEIIFNTLTKQFKKDKLAYLQNKSLLKEGIDYYIGSYKSGKKVVSALKNQFGGIIKESPRLISEDKSTGKRLYRIWISLRLPKFQIGDFIEYENKIGQIIIINNDKSISIDLKTDNEISLPWTKYEDIKLLKRRYEIEKTTIISKSPTIIQILDPEDYSAVDLKMKKKFDNYQIGEEIEVIKINNEIYPITNLN